MSSEPSYRPRAWDVVPVLCALAVLLGWVLTAPELAMTAEDHAWEGFFEARGLAGTWCGTHSSYRPMCGSLLLLESAWPYHAKLATSLALHLAVVALAGGLAARLAGGGAAGRRAAALAAAVPLVWSTQPEVTLWLGGRCELTWVLPGLAGAHAMLSALRRDDKRWSVGAAVFVGLAALGKEPGFLLPFAYAPLAWGHPRGRALRHLAIASALLVPALALRAAASEGVGGYAGPFLARGPIDWAGNLAYGYTKLALGSVIHWPNAVAVASPLVGAALAAWASRRFERGLRWRVVLGLFVLMAPTALVHDPRTLYGSVAYAAVAVGVAAVRWPALRAVACAALVLHAGATLVSQRHWAEVTAARAATMATVRRAAAAAGQERVLLLGLRWRPYGIPASVIVRADFEDLVVDAVLASRYAENALAPLRPARLLWVRECRARFAFDVPPGVPFVPPDVHPEFDDGEVTLRLEEEALLVYGDHRGELRWAPIPCASTR